MKQKNKILIFAGGLLLWSFFLWSWTYFEKTQGFKAELEKGKLLAQNLAAINAPFLQSQTEPLITLGDVQRASGVQEALVVDALGKILAPLSKYGETFKEGRSKFILLSEPILSLNREPLGRAIVLFSPAPETFYSLWFLFFLPPVLAVGGTFYRDRKNKKQKVPAVVQVPHDDFCWLPVVGRLVPGRFYVFDDEGNILSSSAMDPTKHILDLFPEAHRAQQILSVLQELKNKNDPAATLSCLGNIQIGSWRLNEEAKRYLLACS